MKKRVKGQGRAELSLPGKLGRLLRGAETNEDREKEYQLNERKCDEHCGLDLIDGFRLAAHAGHSRLADHSEADANADSSEAECER